MLNSLEVGFTARGAFHSTVSAVIAADTVVQLALVCERLATHYRFHCRITLSR